MACCVDCQEEGKGFVVAHYRDPDLCFEHYQARSRVATTDPLAGVHYTDQALKDEETVGLLGREVSDDVREVERAFLKKSSTRVAPAELVPYFESELASLGFEKTKHAGWVKRGACATEDCSEKRSPLDCTGYCRSCKPKHGIAIAPPYQPKKRDEVRVQPIVEVKKIEVSDCLTLKTAGEIARESAVDLFDPSLVERLTENFQRLMSPEDKARVFDFVWYKLSLNERLAAIEKLQASKLYPENS